MKFITNSSIKIQKLHNIGYNFLNLAHEVNLEPKLREKPLDFAKRLCESKIDSSNEPEACATQVVFARGTQILSPVQTADEARSALIKLSGRNHDIYCVVMVKKSGIISTKITQTRVKFKPLSADEIERYLNATTEWVGKIGGYDFYGLGSRFIIKTIGSHTAPSGIPAYEIYQNLRS
jgi:septum formation protein